MPSGGLGAWDGGWWLGGVRYPSSLNLFRCRRWGFASCRTAEKVQDVQRGTGPLPIRNSRRTAKLRKGSKAAVLSGGSEACLTKRFVPRSSLKAPLGTKRVGSRLG